MHIERARGITDAKNSAGNVWLARARLCVCVCMRVCASGPRSAMRDLHKIANANLVFILALISLMCVIFGALGASALCALHSAQGIIFTVARSAQ